MAQSPEVLHHSGSGGGSKKQVPENSHAHQMLMELLEQMGVEASPEKRRAQLKREFEARHGRDARDLKLKARKITAEARDKFQHVSMVMSDKLEKYASTLPADPQTRVAVAQIRLNDAMQIAGDEVPRWAQYLGQQLNGSPHPNPETMEFLTEYLMLPKSAREDPHVVYYLTARLGVSHRADMRESEADWQKGMYAGKHAVKALREDHATNAGFELGDVSLAQTIGAEGIGSLVSKDHFVLYDETVDAIPPKDPAAVAADPVLAQRKEDNLKWWLTDMNRRLEQIDPEPAQAKQILERMQQDLAQGTFQQVEGDKRVFREIDPKQAQPYINRLKRQIAIQENKAQVKRDMPKVNPDANHTPTFDETNYLEGAEVKNAAGIVRIEDDTLATVINELQAMSKGGNDRGMAVALQNLQKIDRTGLSATDKLWYENVAKKTEKSLKIMMERRFTPDPTTIKLLTEGPNAAAYRDKYFYDRITKILENPDQEAKHQLNLYDEADWDYFTGIVGHAKNGKELAKHYENLKETVMRLGDLEFWANSAAGDVESFKKAVDFMDNKFAVEAVADPWVVEMFHCYEQAIKILRDSNDQEIAANAAAYNPKTYVTQLDEIMLQLFDQSLQNGTIRDYVRDADGMPVMIPGTNTLQMSDKAIHFDTMEGKDRETFEKMVENRKLASLRLAKGMGILTMRGIDLFAHTRTPGVDVKNRPFHKIDWEKPLQGFSSKPLGGLTRWANPMSEWFLMYGFGDTLFVPFFNKIVGGNDSAQWWTQQQALEAMHIAETGDIKQLEKHFGKGAVRLMDMIDDFSFTSAEGPGSKWRIMDQTMKFSDLDRERLGGSIRLELAGIKAENDVKEMFKAEVRRNHPGMDEEKLGELVNEEWKEMMKSEEPHPHRKHWEHLVEQQKETYTAWIWAQTTMRNPQGVASHLFVDYQAQDTGKMHHGKLRSKIMQEIFTADDLRDFKIGGRTLTNLVMERDVADSGSTPNDKSMLLRRISIVDGDLASVQRFAMTSEGRPRDIKLSDFDMIRGDFSITVDHQTVTVSAAKRKEQAIAYWKAVQREMLGKAVGDTGGGWDAAKWYEELRPEWNGEKLTFKNPERIHHVFEQAHAANQGTRLNQDLVTTRLLVLPGTEDLQWNYIDLEANGNRHWSRKGGDFLTRAKTITLMMKHFHALTGKPKQEDLVKSLAEIGQQEKDHDPKEAAKFVSMWAAATNEIYQQKFLAGVPVIGRILPALGIKMSIAQERFGTHAGGFWSMNNQVKFADMIAATRVIPEERYYNGIDYGEYTMKKLMKDMGASRFLAAAELFFIGGSVMAIIVSISALTKGVSDVKDDEH
jgi:hypothetical protein